MLDKYTDIGVKRQILTIPEILLLNLLIAFYNNLKFVCFQKWGEYSNFRFFKIILAITYFIFIELFQNYARFSLILNEKSKSIDDFHK